MDGLEAHTAGRRPLPVLPATPDLAALRPRPVAQAAERLCAPHRGREDASAPARERPYRGSCTAAACWSAPPCISFSLFLCLFPSRGCGNCWEQKCSRKMADGNEDLRADDLPGPAYESYEPMELACPAERSGHVAVGDGRHMFVWGGYKVSGWRRRGRPGGKAGAAAAGGNLPRPHVSTSPVHLLASGNLLTGPPTRAKAPGLLSRRLTRSESTPATPMAAGAPRFTLTVERYSGWGWGMSGGAGLRNVLFKRAEGCVRGDSDVTHPLSD